MSVISETKKLACIKCTCGTEIVVVDVWDDEEDFLAYLWIFTLYNKYPMSFWDKTRHAWHIFKYGDPYSDQVCFEVEELIQLRDAADAAIKLIEERKKKFDERKTKDGQQLHGNN